MKQRKILQFYTIHLIAINYIIDNTGTNPFIDNRNLESEWLDITDRKFVNLSEVYGDTSEDFHNVYDNVPGNSGYQNNIYNSNL